MTIKKIVDLSYEMQEGIITFAYWHPPFLIKKIGRHEVEGRETKLISFGSHSGTHLDAPLHFIKNGKTIPDIPLKKLIGEVTFVDFTNLKENESVTEKMLKNTEITKRMIFKFGWGKYWNQKKFYNGYPFFTKEAAKYLVDKKVELVAMDSPSPDDSRIKLTKEIMGTNIDSPVHKIFLKAGVVLVEYLANLDTVTDYNGWTIVATPLKIKNGDGCPVRACIFK
jgi:arylformamidase